MPYERVSHNASVWNSPSHSVNDRITHFRKSKKQKCDSGMLRASGNFLMPMFLNTSHRYSLLNGMMFASCKLGNLEICYTLIAIPASCVFHTVLRDFDGWNLHVCWAISWIIMTSWLVAPTNTSTLKDRTLELTNCTNIHLKRERLVLLWLGIVCFMKSCRKIRPNLTDMPDLCCMGSAMIDGLIRVSTSSSLKMPGWDSTQNIRGKFTAK